MCNCKQHTISRLLSDCSACNCFMSFSTSSWCTDDVSHCRIVSPDKTEWRLISATLCGWGRCFMADQLWLMTRIREEEDCKQHTISRLLSDCSACNCFMSFSTSSWCTACIADNSVFDFSFSLSSCLSSCRSDTTVDAHKDEDYVDVRQSFSTTVMIITHYDTNMMALLSASLYFSKRGAYWDRLCRDVGWLSRACTVAKRCILGL